MKAVNVGLATLILGINGNIGQGQSLASDWVPISDNLTNRLKQEGKEIGYPGKGTAGVSVDPQTGDIHMVVANQGIWISGDAGKTFKRWDDGTISGRCETGYALNADPAGKRLACFMLDGSSGMTLDNGKTWVKFAQHGRGWDFGVVDWSKEHPTEILALAHESGGELYRSGDAGKTWQLIGKDFTALGMYDAHTYVASKGMGLLLSTDSGVMWKTVAPVSPSSRVLALNGNTGYWLTEHGLLVSENKGLTWHQQGTPLQGGYGPFFGKESKNILVIGRRDNKDGAWHSVDGGQTWSFVASFPTFEGASKPDWTPSKYWAAGWFYNFGWDWKSNLVYCSRMGLPTVQAKTK